jgi:4-aminobutyrate--pyruvate transaminase
MGHQPNSPEARDIAYHLHSYTDARHHQEVGPLIIERGDGIYVNDASGRRYIEAMSGLWSVGVGFSEPRLVEAAAHQMSKLPFYHTFSHKAHSPIIDLAERLVTMAPTPMSKAYFANSGSEANDTALKMIWYRSNALGKPQKKKVISRKRGYHGVTIGSGSLTGLPNNHRSFDLPLPNIFHVSAPHYWRDALPGETEEAFSERLAKELENLIVTEGPETVAAFWAEPIMGAGGVVVPPRGYWERIQAVLQKYDILLVIDEVICGFGRTGEMFGCTTFGIRPDILVLSKQLSSSYLPISALLINKRVYEPIADETHEIGTFGHGFTGGGHPVAAAVSLENLNIIEERGLVANARKVGQYMQKRLRELEPHPLVGEVRGVGLIAAVELVTDKDTKAPWDKVGALGTLVNGLLQDGGVISRNMGDAVAFCPPLIITEQQVDVIVDTFSKTLADALPQVRG